jgi:hydrogenase maturation protease
MKPYLVLGLGNDMLKDDAVGIRVADKLRGSFPPEVEVHSTSCFGLSLLDELIDREKALVIDSYVPEKFVGSEIQECNLDEVGDSQSTSPHFVGLGEIREIMRKLGLGFPSKVHILAIPVSDPITFSYEMSPAVTALVDEAAARARRIVDAWLPVPAR